MKIFCAKYIISLLLLLCVTSCFTGIENTKKITEKDVAKVVQERAGKTEQETAYNSIVADSFPTWERGKLFHVVDNGIKRIFSPSSQYDADTLNIAGKILEYTGYTEGSILDNEPKINLCFSDGVYEYVYSTNKTLEEIKRQQMMLQVPFLVDAALVEKYDELLERKVFYIRTSIWYNEKGEMIPGKKFIRVKIIDVLPGDKVFPLRVMFETEDGAKACLFMSTKQSSVQNRLFDNLFSEKDIRLNYPLITETTWKHIVNGTVAIDMTKDECRLSLGTPGSIQERPTYDGLQEYWFYGDGMYLIFFDGRLKQFRR